MEEPRVVGSYEIRGEITDKDISDVIVGSFEGGSNHWLGVDNTTPEWENKPRPVPISIWATKLLLDGKQVLIYDVEDEKEVYILTLPKVMRGIELNAKCRPWAADKDNWDATDVDCILQYGLFEEIVYS
jgi:hypothetical protein